MESLFTAVGNVRLGPEGELDAEPLSPLGIPTRKAETEARDSSVMCARPLHSWWQSQDLNSSLSRSPSGQALATLSPGFPSPWWTPLANPRLVTRGCRESDRLPTSLPA